ncbi:hypothetical protein CH75_24150 [Dyella jiangningensis]|nr:hypothetical protein CH75_01070 [Dyella jiangningensis]AHX16507.1 hypothetical protein CH75_24150 [Dyella jiangningensis]
MYTVFRSLYRGLDRLVFHNLPLRAQVALKSAVLRMSRTMYPTRIHARNASQLLRAPAGSNSGWSWRPPALPEWVKDEMEALSAIDPDIHPKSDLMQTVEFYSAPWTFDVPGRAYAKLWHALGGRKFDCVIFVPWLKTGGADLGAIRTANALASDFGARVLVVATEDADSPWAGRLSSDITFLEVGATLRDVDPIHRVDVIVRVLLQLAPSVVHVMNSLLAWEAVARNGLALRQTMRLYASLYCDDFNVLGLPVGYARAYLPRCYPYLEAVVTDNTRNPRQWVKQLGVPENLFKVVPFPGPHTAGVVPTSPGRAVLWAGRLDRQKRPELLAAIAAALPDVRFDVYGSAVMGEGNESSQLRSLPNVVLHGTFDSFRAIVKSDHSAFVYTTAWDGLPLVLLDAASVGLPIVAPDIGGVGDFIRKEDLLGATAGVPEYVKDIESLLARSATRQERVARQFESLRTSRGVDVFLDALGKLEGYARMRELHITEAQVLTNNERGGV